MTHITIRLGSPPTGCKTVRDIIRIKTPEGLLHESGDNFVVEREENRAVMVDSCCDDRTTQMTPSTLRIQPQFVHGSENAEGTNVHTNSVIRADDFYTVHRTFSGSSVNQDTIVDLRRNEIREKRQKSECNGAAQSPVKCDSCGRFYEFEDVESELYITRKDLSSMEGQLEIFKSRLEDGLIERFKLEEELKTEAETHESEIQILKEKIECLEESEREKTKKIEELQNTLSVFSEEHEKERQEMEQMREFVNRYQTEMSKLRADALSANDQADEARGEMEILTKKAERNELEKDKVTKQLRSEIESYWREIRELRNGLENWEQVDADRRARIRSLEKELSSQKKLVEELREELTDTSNKTTTDKSINSVVNMLKIENFFTLCQELNENLREHLRGQGKLTELSLALTSTQKELEEARNRSEEQNLALQDFKRKYNDLHDIMVALKEENCHLRNRLEKKCAEFREIRRKFLVSETEVSWLKEALNIVDSVKKKSICNAVKVVDVQT